MKCNCCEKEFEFDTNDIVEFIDCEIGEFTVDFVICPCCDKKQLADYNY
ncbi:MAG: hypothetical protein ACRC0V_12795 [Fusobacteriaceae bacterium]